MKTLAKILTLVLATSAISASWAGSNNYNNHGQPDEMGSNLKHPHAERGDKKGCKEWRGARYDRGDRNGHKGRHRDRRENLAIARQVIDKSGITAEKAIDIVRKTSSGTVYGYELKSRPNRLVYVINLVDLTKQERYRIGVDASNGNIVSESIHRGLDGRRNARVKEIVAAMQKSGFSVKDAIATVNSGNELLVKDVSIRNRQGINFFEVEAVGEAGRQKVLVDIDKKSIIPGFKVHRNGGRGSCNGN